jgi:hypothetical protein
MPVDKLRQTLLLMLSSSHTGEIVAARDAILRLAKTQRYDLHNLADALIRGLAIANKSKPNGSRARAQENISSQQMAQCCMDWDDLHHRFSDKERDFVEDMVNWRHPTEKQLAWLKKIYTRTRY